MDDSGICAFIYLHRSEYLLGGSLRLSTGFESGRCSWPLHRVFSVIEMDAANEIDEDDRREWCCFKACCQDLTWSHGETASSTLDSTEDSR